MFKKQYFFAIMSTLLLSVISVPLALDYSTEAKQGIRTEVTESQQDLKTKPADFQKHKDLSPDVMAGEKIISKSTTLNKAAVTVSKGHVSRKHVTRKHVSRGGTSRSKEVQLLSWFKVDKLFGIGDVATLIDVATGLQIKVQRTYGHNHADVEALTTQDTETLEKVAGGSWNWTRRPIIVEIGGYRIAGSITAMPHAGREDMPANIVVNGRSGDFGSGVNLDAVKGNGMDGHFDIHFYGSKTHSTDRVDEEHQEAIQKAYKTGK